MYRKNAYTNNIHDKMRMEQYKSKCDKVNI